tara:strand:- start:83 stop:595 length:513 start_codon:yes stop_codon:yes gene_type:complete
MEHQNSIESKNADKTTDKIAPALLKAHTKVKKLVANKDNDFYNSSYADLHACIEACQDALNSNDIIIVQGFDHDGANDVFYVTTTLLHKSGQTLSNKVGFPIVKKDPQSIGQLCTYGRRYGLTALMCLAEDDDDANSTGNYTPKTKSQPKGSGANEKVDLNKMASDLAGF